MSFDPNCIFCKIVAKQVPALILYEDDLLIAFPDRAAQAPVHLLIVPKTHVPNLNTVGDASKALSAIPVVAGQLAERFDIAKSGYRLTFNNGPDAGQTVFHVHAHLLGGTPLGEMVTHPKPAKEPQKSKK